MPALPTRSPMARARSEIDTFTIPEGRRRRVYRPGRNDGARHARCQLKMLRRNGVARVSAARPGTACEKRSRISLRSCGLRLVLCELICSSRKRNLRQQPATNQPDGQITKTCPVPRAKIFRFSSDPNQWLFPCRPVSTRGADRASSRTRDGMRWTQAASGAKRVRRAGFPVSGHGAQDDRRCSVRQNRVVLAPVAGVKLPVANLIQPDRLSHQAGSDGGKRNSSPGRARHKPSNHCAGNAGVLRLYLYARVRTSSCTLHTRPRVQQAPGIPCSLSFEGKEFQQTSGAMRRENADIASTLVDRALAGDQYSRDAMIDR